jgi:hypothetical protein
LDEENLPNILMIHLKRIVFDFDTFLNTKINSKLEFPEYLNIEAYTKEGIEIKEFEKKLIQEKEFRDKSNNYEQNNDFNENISLNNSPYNSPIFSRTTSDQKKSNEGFNTPINKNIDELKIVKTLSDIKYEAKTTYKRK